MTRYKDLTNKEFGRLTVVKRAEDRIDKKGKHHIMWECRCACGNTKVVSRNDLTKKNGTKSCGCLRIEKTKERRTKHGLRNTRLYRIWANIKVRCYNPKKDNYSYYGKEGIAMCQEWLNNFENFYKWSIENGYQSNLTIDRINNQGNYEPSNCRWVTAKQQQNNKNNNHLIEYKGETHTLTEWSEMLNINCRTLHKRLVYLNWSIEKALNTPTRKIRKEKT